MMMKKLRIRNETGAKRKDPARTISLQGGVKRGGLTLISGQYADVDPPTHEGTDQDFDEEYLTPTCSLYTRLKRDEVLEALVQDGDVSLTEIEDGAEEELIDNEFTQLSMDDKTAKNMIKGSSSEQELGRWFGESTGRANIQKIISQRVKALQPK